MVTTVFVAFYAFIFPVVSAAVLRPESLVPYANKTAPSKVGSIKNLDWAGDNGLTPKIAVAQAIDVQRPTNIHVRESDNDQESNGGNVSISFDEIAETYYGEGIILVGSISALGGWNPSEGVPLGASRYTNADNIWSCTVELPTNTELQYKFVRLESDGQYVWEADPNHVITVPSDGSASTTVTGTWQSPATITSTSTTASATIIMASTTSSALPTSSCSNSPTSRSCWIDGFTIDTDFDEDWPDTGVTVSYNLVITNTTMAPDGYERMVYAINGQYPGPTIYANWGDTIQITVDNQLPNNGTSIHWHGLRQYHSSTQDGVPGVTECPIAPGGSKTYTFQATQYGTSWYHSHFSCQYGDGVVGSIVIDGPASANYDIDLGPYPVTDWYYPSVQYHALLAEHENSFPPEADDALINGTMKSPYGGSYAQTTLTPGKVHRLRLSNMAVDNHFMVSLDNHNFTVVAADFVPIVPYNTSWIFIGIGERYDVLIDASQPSGSYWFRAEVQDQAGCGTNYQNGNLKSVFTYAGYEAQDNPTSSATSYTQRCTDETGLVPWWNSYVPTGDIVSSFSVLDVDLVQATQPDGSLNVYWNVNSSSMIVDWATPTLNYVRNGSSTFANRSNVLQLPDEGVWTYWLIQEASGYPYDVNVPHPIHLHGHDFFVLGSGSSAWTADDANSLNYDNPTRRDVAMLPTNGWLAIAFQTDNPGIWLMHCHIAWHSDEGFGVQFVEAAGEILSVDPLTLNYDDQCQAWKNYYPNNSMYLQSDSGI